MEILIKLTTQAGPVTYTLTHFLKSQLNSLSQGQGRTLYNVAQRFCAEPKHKLASRRGCKGLE